MTPEPLAQFLRRAPHPASDALALASAIAAELEARQRSRQRVGLDPDHVTVAIDEAGWRVTLHAPPPLAAPPSGLALAARVTLAPEAIAGADADERADVYGIGVILYIALTGRSPFEAASPVESLTIKLCGATSGPAELTGSDVVGAEVDRLVRDLIAADPARRPSLDEARTRLAGLAPTPSPALEPTPPVAIPTSASEEQFFDDGDLLGVPDDDELLAAPRRSRRLLVAAAVLGVALIAVVALLATGHRPPRRGAAPAATARETTTTPATTFAPPAPATREEPPAEEPAAEEPLPGSATPAAEAPRPARRPARAATPPAAPPQDPDARPLDPDWIADAERARDAGKSSDSYRAYFRASRSSDRATAARGHLGMAELGLEQRRYTEALRNARRALDLGADARRAWHVVAGAACALGDVEQAATAHTRLGGGSCP